MTFICMDGVDIHCLGFQVSTGHYNKVFEGFTVSSYSLGCWVNIFQVLKAEALDTPMLYLDGIKRSKGE